MKIPGKLNWDPKSERFTNNEKANKMLKRTQRAPYGTDKIVEKIK
jgi:hypothetical protein